ncbi:MAG: glycoside hydrolase family 88 protein [Bacteroidota bacterium]
MSKVLLQLALGTLLMSCLQSGGVKQGQLDGINIGLVEKRLPFLLSHAVDETGFPRSYDPSAQEIKEVPSKDWTSGFYPGSLIYSYLLTDDKKYLYHAMKWLPHMQKEQYNDRTHDMGFKIMCSLGNYDRYVNQYQYRAVILRSATTLMTRYNPVVGCTKSWNFGGNRWDFPVIIDNMMNLELLFEATRMSGDSSYHKAAEQHAMMTLANHFRPDFSSYHVVDYNPETGQVIKKITHQGLNNESVWSRGQAWGLYGFTMAYRYTRNPQFLQQAINIADFVTTHPALREDKVPYWDMQDPAIPKAPRDASAAAITASALIELAQLSDQKRFHATAKDIITALVGAEYVLDQSKDIPFILDHSTGNMPKNDEIDAPISYADYYLMEALVRLKYGTQALK